MVFLTTFFFPPEMVRFVCAWPYLKVFKFSAIDPHDTTESSIAMMDHECTLFMLKLVKNLL